MVTVFLNRNGICSVTGVHGTCLVTAGFYPNGMCTVTAVHVHGSYVKTAS